MKYFFFLYLLLFTVLFSSCAIEKDSSNFDYIEKSFFLDTSNYVFNFQKKAQPVVTLYGSYYNLDPVNFQKLMVEDVFVLNVNTPYEGELNGTDFFIEEFYNIRDYSEFLPNEFNSTILVYSKTGGMSSQAAEQLLSLGYKYVFHLKGGMFNWYRQGFPILNWTYSD